MEGERELGEVRHEEAEHVAPGEAAGSEPGRQSTRSGGELPIGQHPPARPVDQRGRVAALGTSLQHEAMQGDVGHGNVRMWAPEDHPPAPVSPPVRRYRGERRASTSRENSNSCAGLPRS